MKLKLENFRSFTSADFSFDANYILISGHSGIGKTSIFMAMNFAITGEGKRVVTNGKTKCSVTLELKDISITRTKGPNRLSVIYENNTYEAAEAQAVINRVVQNWELGYVSQRMYKSFISMTPAEKLVLIEKMAFSRIDIHSIHSKCKSLVSDRKTSLVNATMERSTIEKVMIDMGCEDYEPEHSLETIENLLSVARADQIKAIKLLETLKYTLSQKQFLNQQRIDTEEELMHISEQAGDQSYNLKELIRQEDAYNRYMATKRQLDETTPHSELSEKDIDVCLCDIKTLKSLHVKLSHLDTLVKELAVQEEYKKEHAVIIGNCPSCSSTISSWNGKLMLPSGGVQSITAVEAEMCDKKRNKLIADIANLKELEKEQTAILELYDGDIQEQESYLMHVKRNDKLWEACNALKCDKPPENALKHAREMDTAQLTRKMLTSKLEKIIASLLLLEDGPDTVENVTAQTVHLSEKIENLTKTLEAIKARHQWDKVRRLRVLEQNLEEKVQTAVRLTSLVKTAERMALDDVIKNINLRAEIYLSRMLPSISAVLVFEKTKTSIEKIDLNVTMDGLQSDINSLSGGEFARVVLSFAIAMAEMNNICTLLLDESFASLDACTTETVLDAIKENYTGQVIVIAHQTTKGVFDTVVEL